MRTLRSFASSPRCSMRLPREREVSGHRKTDARHVTERASRHQNVARVGGGPGTCYEVLGTAPAGECAARPYARGGARAALLRQVARGGGVAHRKRVGV